MEAREFDPLNDDQMFDLLDLIATIEKHDRPGYRPTCQVMFVAWQRNQDPLEGRTEWRLAYSGHELVGAVSVDLPSQENRSTGWVHPWVRPAHRRRGIGTQLLATGSRIARADGRDTLIARAAAPLPGRTDWDDSGRAFAAAAGFDQAHSMTQRGLELSSVDTAAADRAYADCLARADGYEPVSWTGAAPQAHAAEMARLESRMSSDVPTGTLTVEAMAIDVDRLRRGERHNRLAGRTILTTALRHRDSGTLAAYTQVAVNTTPGDEASVAITLVDPAHRGRRLGMFAKLEMQRRVLRELPEVRRLATRNADVNTHINAINETMGYLPVGRLLEFQRAI